MPADHYCNLRDETAQALVPFLRSQPSVGGPISANGFNVPGAIFTKEEFMVFFNIGTLRGGGKVPTITMKSRFSDPE
jgi:hypothetical protein